MQISPTGKIYSSFYRKPTTKNLFVHFKSSHPFCAQTNYIRNEIKRIHNRCSKEKDKIKHTAHFINILRHKDYPTSIARHLNNKKSRKLRRPFNTYFLKLPHFDGYLQRRARYTIDPLRTLTTPIRNEEKSQYNMHSSQLPYKGSKHM